MTVFSQSDIRDAVRDASDIVEVIGSYIPLKQMGINYKACCPFHKEKTPSFVVNPERQSFHCFGCGKGGDVYKFVMEYENVDFMTAMRLLADRAHIVIPERGQSADVFSGGVNRKDRLYAICEHLCSFFQMELKMKPHSVVSIYLDTRNLDSEILEKFRIGASPDGWDQGLCYLRKQGFTDEEIKLAGVVSESEKSRGKVYDRFRNRLMFPIWNEQGKVVGFSARKVLEDEGGGKYINSPETPLFKKSRILYGFSLARKMIHNLQAVILCEGQLDVIAMHRAGFENAVAPQGTAFTIEQATLLRRQTDRLYLAFDSDSAGQEAILKALEIALPLDFEIRVIQFPGGKDPDELYRNEGAEVIHGAVHQAMDFMLFLLERFKKQFDVKTPAGKSKIANLIIPYIVKLENEIKLATYCAALAKQLELPESAIAGEIKSLRRVKKPDGNEGALNVFKASSYGETEKQSLAQKRILIIEETLLQLALEYEMAARSIATEIEPRMFGENPIANALDSIVQLTLNGEWVLRNTVIQNECHDGNDTSLSRYLVLEPLNLDDAKLRRSIEESIFNFKEAYYEREIELLMQQMDQTAEMELFFQIQNIQQALREHRKLRHYENEKRMVQRASNLLEKKEPTQEEEIQDA